MARPTTCRIKGSFPLFNQFNLPSRTTLAEPSCCPCLAFLVQVSLRDSHLSIFLLFLHVLGVLDVLFSDSVCFQTVSPCHGLGKPSLLPMRLLFSPFRCTVYLFRVLLLFGINHTSHKIRVQGQKKVAGWSADAIPDVTLNGANSLLSGFLCFYCAHKWLNPWMGGAVPTTQRSWMQPTFCYQAQTFSAPARHWSCLCLFLFLMSLLSLLSLCPTAIMLFTLTRRRLQQTCIDTKMRGFFILTTSQHNKKMSDIRHIRAGLAF